MVGTKACHRGGVDTVYAAQTTFGRLGATTSSPLAPLRDRRSEPISRPARQPPQHPAQLFRHAEIRTVACEAGEFVGDVGVGVGLQHCATWQNGRGPTQRGIWTVPDKRGIQLI